MKKQDISGDSLNTGLNPELETGGSILNDGQFDVEIEELAFDEKPRKSHGTAWYVGWTAAAIALVLVLAGGGYAGWYMWQNHWRPVDVVVNGGNVQRRVDTTISKLLEETNSFGKKRGKLFDVTGELISEHGGGEVQVSVNGRALTPDEYATTVVPEGGSISVRSGEDTVEEHTVSRETIPYKTNIGSSGVLQIVEQLGKDGEKEVWTGKTSGKKIDKRVTVEPQTLEVRGVNPNPQGRKVIALTFDDGPSDYTPAILDILKNRGVHATFFNLGDRAVAYESVEKRLVAEGHQLASHSESHQNMPDLDREQLRSEISQAFDHIHKASGVSTRVMRPPYGAFGEQQWKDAADLLDMNVIWSIDSLDWKRPGVDAIVNNVVPNAYNGAVILMHDGGGDRSQDVEALPKIIDALKQQGYEFVTIDQLRDLA